MKTELFEPVLTPSVGPVIFRDRGIADLKRNLENSQKKKKFFFLNVSRTWLLSMFCPFCCPHTALVVICLSCRPFTC